MKHGKFFLAKLPEKSSVTLKYPSECARPFIYIYTALRCYEVGICNQQKNI